MVTTLNPNGPLNVQRFDFAATFSAPGRISRSWGPTLRGGFGRSLHRVACSLGRDSCKDCLLGASCAYGYIFETPIIRRDSIMRKYPQAPHPFVLEPNLQGKTQVESGESVQNGLVVVGEAIRYLPYFFLAIEELGRQGFGRDRVTFRVDRMTTEDGATIYERGRGNTFAHADLLCLSVEPGVHRAGRFSLQFETPARITVDGRTSREPSLVDIVKTLCRRAFLLRYFHCGRVEQQVSTDFIEAAQDARCIDRTGT
jgi:hypothetical protein